MNACEARCGYEKRGWGGLLSVLGPVTKSGGGGGLSVLGPIRKAGGGSGDPIQKVGGGGGGCLPYDDLYLRLCARAWGVGGGGGGNWSQRAAFHMNGGGGGGGGRHPQAYAGSGAEFVVTGVRKKWQ